VKTSPISPFQGGTATRLSLIAEALIHSYDHYGADGSLSPDERSRPAGEPTIVIAEQCDRLSAVLFDDKVPVAMPDATRRLEPAPLTTACVRRQTT